VRAMRLEAAVAASGASAATTHSNYGRAGGGVRCGPPTASRLAAVSTTKFSVVDRRLARRAALSQVGEPGPRPTRQLKDAVRDRREADQREREEED
jgi:hypothetical protein